jgi:hypothetical protein
MWSVEPRFANKPLAGLWTLQANDRLIVNLTSSSSFRLYLLDKQQYAMLDQNVGEKSCCSTCLDPPICYNADREKYDFTSTVTVANTYRLVAVCPNLLTSCVISGNVHVLRRGTILGWNTASHADAAATLSTLALLVSLLSLALGKC